MHCALAGLASLQFSSRKLILPCIVHRVRVVKLKREDLRAQSYVHGIEAVGLRPLEIVLSEKLVENGSWTLSRPPYALVRPWD